MLAKSNRSSNDQRSDVHNSTSTEHKAALDNRANQINPNYQKSKAK